MMKEENVEIEFNWKIYENPEFWIKILDSDKNVVVQDLIKINESGEVGLLIDKLGESEVYRVWPIKEITMVVPRSIFELFEDLIEKSGH